MDVDINADLELYGTYTTVPGFESLLFDYSLLRAPYVDTYIAADLNATFFDPMIPQTSSL